MKKGLIFGLIWLSAMGGVFAQTKGPFAALRLMQKEKKITLQRDPAKAIEQLRELLPQMPTKTWRQRDNSIYLSLTLCDLYVRTGRYDVAEHYLDSLTDLVQKLHPRWWQSRLPFAAGTIYDAFETLGYLCLTTGSFKKAEASFRTSMTLREQAFPQHSVYRVAPLVGMGSLEYRRGNEEGALDWFNKASRMMGRATTTYFDYDNISRRYLSDLAELCLASGRYQEGWAYINKLALASSGIAKFGSRIGSRLEIARIFELKARYYLLIGDFGKAQDYLDRAKHYTASLTTVSSVSIKLLKTQALVFWQQGQTVEADSSFLRLVHAYREQIDRNFISMSDYEKEQFFNTLRGDLDLFNAITLSQSIEDAPRLYTQMLDNTLNTKALLLNASNKIRNHILRSGNQELVNNLREWEKDKSLISSYYFDKDADVRIDSLGKAIETLERKINAGSRLFASEEHKISWRDVESKLKAGEAAIEIIRINTLHNRQANFYGANSGLSDSVVYLALIMKPDLDMPQRLVLPAGNRMDREGLAYYRNSLLTHSRDTLSYKLFWKPLRDQLSGVRRVYVSPDGAYNELNLNTLFNASSGRYLLNEMEVVNLTNCADLMRNNLSLGARQPAVLVGRPAYDEKLVEPTGDIPAYGSRSVLSDELDEFRDQEFSDLAGTETEVRTIGGLLRGRGMSVETLLGANALEDSVKAVHDPAVLHIATHGFFVADAASAVNPMIRSGLILAGVHSGEAREGASDGILTAYEATNLALDSTNVVVLSACETGLGEVRNGEGVYGLQRAIMVAGARNLLMSLWKVDDTATAALMIEFYKNWNGVDNQDAFRKAQLTMQERYPDPYYWGAFLMLGQ